MPKSYKYENIEPNAEIEIEGLNKKISATLKNTKGDLTTKIEKLITNNEGTDNINDYFEALQDINSSQPEPQIQNILINKYLSPEKLADKLCSNQKSTTHKNLKFFKNMRFCLRLFIYLIENAYPVLISQLQPYLFHQQSFIKSV